jgi:hypothetical protein
VKKIVAAVSSVLAVLCLLAPLLEASDQKATSRQDSSWKRYHNLKAAYCVSYPARWQRGDAFEGAGLFVEAGVKKRSRPTGEIDVALLPSAEPSQPRLTLVDDLKVHLDGLKRFQRAQKLEILEQRQMNLVGSPALFSKNSYYDPMDRSSWIEEVVLVSHNEGLYRLELECRADQIDRFEKVFTTLLSTFQFDCGQQ